MNLMGVVMKPNLRLQRDDVVELVFDDLAAIDPAFFTFYPTELVYVVDVTEDYIQYTWDKSGTMPSNTLPRCPWNHLKAVNRLWRD